MTCMDVSIYMLVCENDIFINIFNIFCNLLHISHLIFYTNALYIKFLNSFSLPDVSSTIMLVSSVVSVVFSVTVMVGVDTTSNTLEICIDRS